ncbi:hypothetical protein TNCV_1721651 [Trichonephila clavipes]|nr:hypothetical protein TNCV_1721651 [Trichonephila clavipes]
MLTSLRTYFPLLFYWFPSLRTPASRASTARRAASQRHTLGNQDGSKLTDVIRNRGSRAVIIVPQFYVSNPECLNVHFTKTEKVPFLGENGL